MELKSPQSGFYRVNCNDKHICLYIELGSKALYLKCEDVTKPPSLATFIESFVRQQDSICFQVWVQTAAMKLKDAYSLEGKL